MKRLAARLRRGRYPELEAARAVYATGAFEEARRLALPLAEAADAPLEALRGLAELEYLLGNYAAAESLLERVVAVCGRDAEAKLDAEVALALVYLQTNRFAAAHGLFAGIEDAVELPIWTLMKSFGDTVPYRLDRSGPISAELPFLQRTDWELPRVAVEANGRRIEARLDTGGELVTLSREDAAMLGVETVISATGVFAGGAQGELAYGRLDSLSLGGLALSDVPVAVVGLDTSVLGTGLLRQFLSTLDYPGGRLVLRPRGAALPSVPGAVEVPFVLALSHLIVVRGSLDGVAPLTFIVDSGLQDEEGAGFAAPPETLAAAGIRPPATVEVVRESGAGHVPLQLGRFPVRSLGLGPLAQHDVIGLAGVFPDVWREAAGFAIHGLVSHGFLRRYSWTLDFDAMTMTFVEPAGI